MSETIRTKHVEIDDAPSRENRVSLAELLVGVGWLAYQVTRLAVKGTIAGVKQTAKAVQVMRENSQAPQPLTLSGASRIVSDAPDAAPALRELAAHPGLAIPVSQAPEWRRRLNQLSPASNKVEIATFAREIIQARQEYLQSTALQIAARACTGIGFTPRTVRGTPGLLTATSGDGGRKITIEVAKGNDGDMRMYFDTHGFRGGECTRMLDTLQEELRARGVRFRIDCRRRKDRSPAIDVTRIPSRQRMAR